MDISAENILSGEAYSFSIVNGIVESLKKIPNKQGLDFYCPGGFCDTQVNGYLGMDFSDPGLTVEMVDAVSEQMNGIGTFHFFPTIVTRPQTVIVQNIKTILKEVKSNSVAGKSISGIHIEGPFISPVDGPRGAHDLKSVRKASIAEFDEWLTASEGLLKVITIAPEIDGAIELIKHAVENGVVCSIGHSAANQRQIDEAVDSGASMSTHLGNGVYSRLERFDNPVFSQLANPGLSIGLIADGAHVGAALLKVVSLCRKRSEIVLVSDLAPMAGMKNGTRMKWGNMNVEIASDSSVRLAGTPYLAGAGSSLLNDVLNYSHETGMIMSDCAKMATINPKMIYKLDCDYSELKQGKKAELVLFSKNGIKKVWR
ncbi:MAG: amidohydrolase family protein [Candidatus Cloacimonetes bacterium]|nr:amidohydrolase family protein [Candidatus Cloacimonadota bacterium]